MKFIYESVNANKKEGTTYDQNLKNIRECTNLIVVVAGMDSFLTLYCGKRELILTVRKYHFEQ